jgi:quinol monooxygenase YgiN
MSSHQSLRDYSPIVELRQYTLHPGQRDILIDLFEREFIEPQEEAGITVIGQFRDIDSPNRFVWLRGFRDMHTRHDALQAFYGGPVWRAHRDAANATMVDSDNVLLLRPARPASGFYLDRRTRPPHSVQENTLVVATTLYWKESPSDIFLDLFEHELCPILIQAGASILSYFVTEPSENTFRALPVREGEHVFVWFSRFRDQMAYDEYVTALAQLSLYHELWQPVARRLKRPPEILKLAPTSRSLVCG